MNKYWCSLEIKVKKLFWIGKIIDGPIAPFPFDILITTVIE